MPKQYRRKTNPSEQELRSKWLGPVYGPVGLTEDVVAARVARARNAAERGLNITRWAAEEGVSAASVSLFLRRPDVPADLAESLRRNGNKNVPPPYYYFWMLKCLVMSEAGLWTAEEMAEKSGVHPTTLANIRRRKCPDGNMREALELEAFEVFQDDEIAEDVVRRFYRQVRRQAEGVARRPVDIRRHTHLDRFSRVAYRNAEMLRKNKARHFLETNLA